MASEKEVERFIRSQRTFTAQGPEYKRTKKALRDVLLALPDKDYEIVTKNLVLSVLHEKSLGQVMHLKTSKGKFMIMQLTVPRDMPIGVLRWVIAHELGHAMQGRNWRKSDGYNLEIDATQRAKMWGFSETKSIKKWIDKRKKRLK
jgi:hypothetical protein